MAKRRQDVALSNKLEILENYLALPNSVQNAAAEQLHISRGCLGFDKMHEFEKLNGHIRQFLHYQQPMRQLTFDVFALK